MHSELLAEYLRTGTMPPLLKGDTKSDVESKLGPPDDWKGRIPHIGWREPPLADFHDSWAWHYGSLCVSFPDPALYGLTGISLDFGFVDSFAPVRFPAPFQGLPQTPFTLAELVFLLDNHGIHYKGGDGHLWVTEGDVGIGTLRSDYSPTARVVYLFPHPYKLVRDDSLNALRQRLIETFSEMLRQPDLSDADRITCEASLKELENQKALNRE